MSEVNKLIPQLRFPEFLNEGEWVEKKLGEIAENIMYGMNSAAIEYDGENKYIRITDIDENTRMFSPNPIYSPDGQLDDKYLLNKGDILFARTGASVGKSYIHKTDEGKIYFAGFLIRFSITGEVPYFVYTQTLTKQYQKWVTKTSMRSGQPGINAEEYKLYPICLPPTIQEQQKIASCLSSLDEVIAAHSQKLKLLKDHKKGLMQNLFPQEGEKVPKLRFKEFEKDGEWAEKSFGEVYNFKVTNSFSRECLNYEKGKVKNIHYGDIHTKFNTLFDITKERVPFINQNVSIEKIKKESYCIEGDIIFADASEDLNDVGKSIEIINLNNEKLVSGLHTLLARQREKKIAIGFGGYLFKSNWIRKQIQREAQGAKVLGISATRISDVIISYPKNPKEQQKIASCLSALDELITAQTEKIEQLKLHKKGLMQGLFPKLITN